MPRTHGDGIIHISEINTLVEVNYQIPSHENLAPTEIEQTIGDHVAGLIEDKSNLQMGIENIPNAVLSRLGNHKNLGLHTEMFSDGVIDLILNDVINGNYERLF